MSYVAPPGWYADPGGQPLWRWWDGSQWTIHAAPVGPAVPPVRPERAVEEEGSMARWARIALPVYAVTNAASLLLMWRSFAFFGRFAEAVEAMPSSELPSSDVVAIPPVFREMMTTIIAVQLLGLLSLATIIILAIWFYRAARAASQLGIPARRSPGLATGSWFIPVVNIWWPCQSTRDLLPDGHEMRPRITQLWVTAIVAAVLTPLGFVAVMMDVVATSMATIAEASGEVFPPWDGFPVEVKILAILGPLVTAAVLIAARGVVAAVLAEHQRLVVQRGAPPASA